MLPMVSEPWEYEAARALFVGQRASIYHSVRLYKPDGSNVDACRRQAVEEGLRILMPGTLGAELIEDLKTNKDVRLNPELLFNVEFQEKDRKSTRLNSRH